GEGSAGAVNLRRLKKLFVGARARRAPSALFFLHRGGGRAEPGGVSLFRRVFGWAQSNHRFVERLEALRGGSRGDAGSVRTDALRAFRRHHLGEWDFNGSRE